MTTTENELPSEAITQQPPKGWVLLAAPILGTVLALVLLAIPLLVYFLSHRGAFGPDDIRALLTGPPYGYFIMLGSGGVFYLGILLAVWLLLPKQGPASLASYFPPVSQQWMARAIAAGLGLAVFVLPAIGLAAYLTGVDLHEAPGEMALVPKNLIQLAFVLIVGAVLAPLVEEVYFRGVMLRWLRKWMGLWLAIAINALFFALVHGRFLTHPGLEGAIVTLALAAPGAVLGWFAVRSGSLWPGVVVHGTYNGLLLTLSYFAPNIG